jgi:hypothetical protein
MNLYACPFCGTSSIISKIDPDTEISEPCIALHNWNGVFVVQCTECGCSGPMEETGDLAIEAWNKPRRLQEAFADIQKYRLALNRIAHPKQYNINPGFEREIARRALVIGMTVEPLPDIAIANAEPETRNPEQPSGLTP